MAKYKGIKGFKVQSLASDPTADEGQIWYNTASNTLKYDSVGAGAWATGATVNITRNQCAGAGRSSSAALLLGGTLTDFYPPYSAVKTESYDGTSWTNVADFTTQRSYFAGCGSQTAAMITTAEQQAPTPLTAKTELYNGTGWTEVADVNTARKNAVVGGTITSALIAGGPGSLLTETYDGSTWTETGDLNSSKAKAGQSSSGTVTAFLAFGNYPTSALTEAWNGTAWTEVADLGSARYGGGSSGDQTNSMYFGGSATPAVGDETELWNGTSWTEIADMTIIGLNAGSAGNAGSTSSILMAGQSPGTFNQTEVWDGAPAVVKTVTVS
tara:strand:+ start:204 stop:1184 length:981 start_codon:yes stop_codon:yes gene_type:complete